MAWTDDRMDDLARRMDAGFAHASQETAALRTEFRNDIGALRIELKGDIDALRSLMLRFGISLVIGLFSLVAALIGAIVAGPLGG